jgi:hypothetical protein
MRSSIILCPANHNPLTFTGQRVSLRGDLKWLDGRKADRLSAVGQTEKNSVRAYVFRFALKLGHRSAHSGCLKGAIVGSKYACVQCEIPADLPFRKTSLRYPILVGLTHKLMRKYSAYARGEPLHPGRFPV